MIRRLMLLALAFGLGYFMGFRDARQHEKAIAGRIADRLWHVTQRSMAEQRDVIEKAAGDMVKAAAEELRSSVSGEESASTAETERAAPSEQSTPETQQPSKEPRPGKEPGSSGKSDK